MPVAVPSGVTKYRSRVALELREHWKLGQALRVGCRRLHRSPGYERDSCQRDRDQRPTQIPVAGRTVALSRPRPQQPQRKARCGSRRVGHDVERGRRAVLQTLQVLDHDADRHGRQQRLDADRPRGPSCRDTALVGPCPQPHGNDHGNRRENRPVRTVEADAQPRLVRRQVDHEQQREQRRDAGDGGRRLNSPRAHHSAASLAAGLDWPLTWPPGSHRQEAGNPAMARLEKGWNPVLRPHTRANENSHDDTARTRRICCARRQPCVQLPAAC